ncbi:hypothetical protein P3S68_002877 [Capsicum galapagoense]
MGKRARRPSQNALAAQTSTANARGNRGGGTELKSARTPLETVEDMMTKNQSAGPPSKPVGLVYGKEESSRAELQRESRREKLQEWEEGMISNNKTSWADEVEAEVEQTNHRYGIILILRK